jgi:VIT1/CCC1 family predicted Fe2+/Mn2+ transporter
MAKNAANGTPTLVPRPDPTLLTTEQLMREIGALRGIIETRLDSMDKASDLLHADVLRYVDLRTDTVNIQIAAINSESASRSILRDEKLNGLSSRIWDFIDEMKTRFQERDTRSEREARDNKIAVDAAFAAAKEAVAENNKSSALATDKSEAGFTKQIDQLTLLIETRAKASDDKIDDIKEQLSNRRGHDTAVVERGTSNLTVVGLSIAATAVLVSLVYLIVFIATR